MPLQNIFNIGWMSSLAQDALLQTFYIDNILMESGDNLLKESGDLYILEDSGTGEGFLLKSDGGKLLLS